MADSLIDKAKAALGSRRNVLDDAEAEATGVRAAPVPATALTPKPKPVSVGSTETMDEKAARFKFERENPGVPYVKPVPKMADGGMIVYADSDYDGHPAASLEDFGAGLRRYMNGGAVCKPGKKTKMYATGGEVDGPGGPTDDKVPALLSDGEYVLPADTVKHVGVRNLDRLLAATHKPTGKKSRPGHFMEGTPGSFDPYAEYGKPQFNAAGLNEYGPELRPQAQPSLLDKANEVARSPGWRQQVGKAKNYVKDKLTSGFRRVTTNPAVEAATGPNAGNYERFAGQELRNQPMTPSEIARPAGPPTPESLRSPMPTRAPGSPTFSPDGLRQPGLAESARAELNARGLTPTPDGYAEAVKRGAPNVRGPVARVGGNLARGLVTPGAVGVGAALYSPETSEPTDSQLPTNTGLRVSDAGAALSSRQQSMLLADVNSGDPVRAAAAKEQLVGSNPRLYSDAVPATSKPLLSPEETQQYVATTVNNAQAGKYDDQVSRGMRQAGIDSPLTPTASADRVVPNMMARDADATEYDVGPGQGVLTGTDKDGVRRTIFATPDMATRNVVPGNPNAKAELAALNARDANAGVLSDAAQKENVLANNLRQAAYEKSVATSGSNAILNRRGARQANLNYQQADSALQNFQKDQTDLGKAKLLADASRSNAELGLRGTLGSAAIQADASKYATDQGAKNARANLQVEMAKYIEGRRDKNRQEEIPWLKDRYTTTSVNKDTGKTETVTDYNAMNDFAKYVKSKDMQDFLKRNGVQSWDDLTTSDKEAVVDAHKRQMAVTDQAKGLTSSGNDEPQGPPTSAKLGEMGFTTGLTNPWGSEQSNVGVTRSILAKLNPLNSSLPSSRTVTVQFGGAGKAQTYALKDLAAKPELAQAVLAKLSPQDQADVYKVLTGKDGGPKKGVRQ